jgi:hypothetical protein
VARQKPADAAKAKAAKQKKIAIVLCCVLALAMAYAVHTMMGMNGGGAKPVAAGPSATTTTPAPTSTDTPAAAPTLAGSLVSAPVAPAPTDTSGLIAVVKPPAGTGQLESFSRFSSKDPFAGGAPAPGSSGSTGSGTAAPGSGTASPGSGSGAAPAVPPAPPSPPPTTAVISVNDVPESVTSGANFPAANPNPSANGLFTLRSLTSTTATIAIVGGSYASGSQTIVLHVNKAVTLVNTADGTRYKIMLNPQGTVAPTATASPGSSGSTSPPAAPAVPSGSGG